jgi:drug/metabolite transporter (DMT)-like permease
MKTTSLALLIVGILVFLAGTVFAFQGDGMIRGSSMTGNPFWIYAGLGVAVVGLLIAFAGFFMGYRRTATAMQTTT